MTAYLMDYYEQDDFFYQLGVDETEKAHEFCNKNAEKIIYAINQRNAKQRAIQNLWSRINNYCDNIGNK